MTAPNLTVVRESATLGDKPLASLESERAVVGGILLVNEALAVVRQLGLGAEHFYLDAHAIVFDCMLELAAAEQPIDTVTLRDALAGHRKLARVGGDEFLLALTDTIPIVANIRAHAEIVIGKAALRRVQHELRQGIMSAQRGELEDAHEAARRALEIKSEKKRVVLYTPRQLIDHAEQSARSDVGGIGGIPTGFDLVDKWIGGRVSPGEVIVIGGQSGCAKSHIALESGIRACSKGHGVGWISCEDPKKRVGTRMAVRLGNQISAAIIESPQLTMEQRERMNAAKERGDRMRWRYADCYNEDVEAVLDAVEACAEAACNLIVVDHLHAIQSSPKRGQTTADVVCETVRRLARATRSRGAVLMLVAQLGKPDKRNRFEEPTMYDFRDTSQVYISADVMLLTWKPSDADGVPIYGKVAKLKDKPQRPRFKVEFDQDGALFDLVPYVAPKDEESGSGWGRKSKAAKP